MNRPLTVFLTVVALMTGASGYATAEDYNQHPDQNYRQNDNQHSDQNYRQNDNRSHMQGGHDRDARHKCHQRGSNWQWSNGHCRKYEH
ncbi:hypothetical protein OL229_10465 [Neisseriaceae bacterium JH1-16]|nr:hypothetical protein [Neisseriaceae bacterium JH1-16]